MPTRRSADRAVVYSLLRQAVVYDAEPGTRRMDIVGGRAVVAMQNVPREDEVAAVEDLDAVVAMRVVDIAVQHGEVVAVPVHPAVSGRAGYLHVADRPAVDRKSVVEGKSGSVRLDHGGRSIIKKKKL